MRYQSKIDLWLAILLAGLSGLLIYSGYELLVSRPFAWTMLLSIMILMLVIYCIWLPFFSTQYWLSEHALEIRCMCFRWQIEFQYIQSMQTCVSFASAPALSMQRVEIIYVMNGLHESLQISPKERAVFCQQLAEKIALAKKPK